MLTVIVLLLYLLTVLFDFLPVRKKRPQKENMIYCALLSVSFVILILFTLDIKVPGPSEIIKNVVEAVFGSSS